MSSNENMSGRRVIGVLPTIQQPRRFLETFDLETFNYALSWDAFNLGPGNHASANAPMCPCGSMDHRLHPDSANERGLRLHEMTLSEDTPGDAFFHSLMGLPQEHGLITDDDLRLYGLAPCETSGTPPPFSAMRAVENLDSTAGDGDLPSCDFGRSEIMDISCGLFTLSDEMELPEFLALIDGNDLQLSGSGSSRMMGTPIHLSLLGPYTQHQNEIIPAGPELQVPQPCGESEVVDQRQDMDYLAGASAPSPPIGSSGNGLGDGVSPSVDDTVSATGDALRVADEADANPGLSATSDGLSMEGRTTARRPLRRLLQTRNTSARLQKTKKRRGPGSRVRRGKRRQQRKDPHPGLLVKEFILLLNDGPVNYHWNRHDKTWCGADEEVAGMVELTEILKSSPQLVQILGHPGWGYKVLFGWNETSARFEGHAEGDSDVYQYSIPSMEMYMFQLMDRGRAVQQ